MPKYDDLDLDVQTKKVSKGGTVQPDSTSYPCELITETILILSENYCPPQTTPCTARFCSSYDC